MSAQSRTRVGIIGAGNIAAIAQLPTLVKRDDVELVALVSRRPDPVPLMRRWGFGAAYQTVQDMLDSEELDAVFVLTPRSEHAHAVDASDFRPPGITHAGTRLNAAREREVSMKRVRGSAKRAADGKHRADQHRRGDNHEKPDQRLLTFRIHGSLPCRRYDALERRRSCVSICK